MFFLVVSFLVLLSHNCHGRPQFVFEDYDYSDSQNQNRNPNQNFNQFTEAPPFGSNSITSRPQGPRFTFVRPPGAGMPPGATTTATPDNFFRCLQGCVITSQYNPVCGTDNQTYNNISRLRCAVSCGLNTAVRRNGPCVAAGK